ncbi:hypothetical protein GQ568_03380, partial [Patescibacteria group bacterium]|nr:hypothetical protein [Patescibacteria group bacterium]
MEELNKKTLLRIFLGLIFIQVSVLLAISANFLLAQTFTTDSSNTTTSDTSTVDYTTYPDNTTTSDNTTIDYTTYTDDTTTSDNT